MNFGRFLDGLFRRTDPAIVEINARDADPGNPVLTLVSIVYSTADKTFSGPAVYITEELNSLSALLNPTHTVTDDPKSTDDSSAEYTGDADTSAAAASSTIGSSPSSSTDTDIIPTTTPTPTPSITMAPSTTHIEPTSAVQHAATNSPSPTSAASGGMTGGAKAGLAFGLIILFALIGGGLYYLYRRYKAKHEAHERLDDEKMAMTQPDALPRFPEPDTMAAAAVPRAEEVPRLSIRPMTEFDPNFSADRRSAAPGVPRPSVPASNLMPAAAVAGAAVVAGAVAQKEATGLRKPGVSAWERPGAERNAVNDPANPFGNHAETISSSPPGSSHAKSKDADLPAPPVAPAAQLDPPPVNPADFPLPASIPPSPATSSFSSNISGQSKGSDGAAAAVAGAVAVAAVGAAAVAKNSPKKPAPQGPVHRVQMDFMPSMEDELEIHTGQLLRMKHEYDDGWALCELMDGSKSGVVPRSCLSKNPLQARPANAPRQGMPAGRPGPGPPRGPGPNGPGSIPRPLTPGGGRASPAPGGRASPGPGMMPRPLTPNGRNSPAPYAQGPRPMSPVGGPSGPRRGRASSNASPYVAYQPGARSASPGPYGAGGLKPTPRPDALRRRSKSVSEMAVGPAPAGPAPAPALATSPTVSLPSPVVRKPVGGHRPSPSS